VDLESQPPLIGLIRKAPRSLVIVTAAFLALMIETVMAPSVAQEADPPRVLIPGKGSELTTARCATCHDAQHITRTKLSRGEWEFNIKNMIERGAPIAPAEIPIIVEYLSTYYNRDSVAPPADPVAASFGMDAGGGDPVQRLLNANACVACHTIDRRMVGPSFREVAAKFSGDRDAGGKLATKIREGGAGNWGNVPMPPNAGISETELNQIVGWILQLR
jgi:cytochrome c551/c552